MKPLVPPAQTLLTIDTSISGSDDGMRRPGFGNSLPSPGFSPVKRRKSLSRTYYYYLLFMRLWPFLLVCAIGAASAVYIFREEIYKAVNPVIAPLVSGAAGTVSPQVDPSHLQKADVADRFDQFVPTYGFVMFSSYRTGPKTFAAVGLSGVVLRSTKKIGTCLWKETGGGHRVKGTIQAFYPGEHHDLQYETINLLCTLEESTEHDTGGKLIMKIDSQDIVVYNEEAGSFPSAEPKAPFKRKLAFCSHPIHKPVSPRRLYEWIEYHVHQGVDFLTLYDAGGLEEDAVAMLEQYSKKGMVEVVDLRKIEEFESWEHGTLLAINDCAYRHRYTSKWVVSMELSEYYDSQSGISLSSLLETFPGKAYVTLGSRWWSVEKCVADKSKKAWAVERMHYHWPHVYCTNRGKFPETEMCLDYYGFRRYAVDPRQVIALQIHRPEVPQMGGVDVNTDEARLNRFPNLVDKTAKACDHVVNEGEVVDWWTVDESLVKVVQKAKLTPTVSYRGQS